MAAHEARSRMRSPPRIARRAPSWSELRPLLQLRAFEGDARLRRLARAASIQDLRRIAQRRTPRSVFDYVDGAAESEVALRRARRTFANVEFLPTVLRDVSEVDTSTPLLGTPSALPFIFAPTWFTRKMHNEVESSVDRAAWGLAIPGLILYWLVAIHYARDARRLLAGQVS